MGKFCLDYLLSFVLARSPGAPDIQWFYSGPKREITRMRIIGERGIKIQKFGTLEVCQEDHFSLCKDLR